MRCCGWWVGPTYRLTLSFLSLAPDFFFVAVLVLAADLRFLGAMTCGGNRLRASVVAAARQRAEVAEPRRRRRPSRGPMRWFRARRVDDGRASTTTRDTAVVLRPSRRRRGVTLCAAVCGFSDAGGRPRFQLLRAAREGLWLLLFALAGSDCARSHRCGAKQVRSLKTKKSIKTGFPKIVMATRSPCTS